MPIENRNLEAGTRLVARHKKQEHVCEVVQTDDGIVYRTGGKDYNSPSSAGRAVTGGVAVNGTAKKSAKKAAKPKAARSRDSYGCGVCGDEFPTMKAATKHALTHTAS